MDDIQNALWKLGLLVIFVFGNLQIAWEKKQKATETWVHSSA